MKSKHADPPAPGEPAQSHPLPTDFLSRPEFQLAVPAKQKRPAVLLLVLLLVLVLAIAAGFGGYRYYLAHRTKAARVSATEQVQGTDPYAGWKTYCDTFYQYCFRYPSDWLLTVHSTPTSYCDPGDVSVTDPSTDVAVSYINTDSHDGGLLTFYPVSVSGLPTAHQALSVVGGYIPTSGPPNSNGLAGNDVPRYQVTDSSTLTTYPLTVGRPAQFPNNVMFTDQNTVGYTCTGSFTAQPTFSVNTLEDAQAWFTSGPAKTSLLILKSLYYQQQPISSNPYAGWQTYTDTDVVPASGISIKYPSGWHVDTTTTKTYGWSIVDTTNTNIITVNDIFWDGSQTARQVWEACEGTDACNGGSDAKTLSDSESSINGLDAYTATIQTDYGTYHMTMIRGNKPTAPAGTPYVWFTTYTTDQAALNTFDKIVASATFPD